MKNPHISAIAAISSTKRALGNNNQLLWHIPADLQYFKETTKGHPVIMGRKTYDSIFAYLGKPLPGRTNIVLTRSSPIDQPGVISVHTIEDAIAHAKALNPAEIFIIGGAAIYDLALPLTDRLYLTLVEDEPVADTFFPDYNADFKETARQAHTLNDLTFSFVTLERR